MGGIVQCGGVHLECTYILGSYVIVPSLGGLPVKWNCRCMDQNNQSYDFCHSHVQELVRVGVGINFCPSPNKEHRFFCGLCFLVKSWNARLDGHEK